MSEPARRLDERGRCCGRKPIPYRTTRHWFCDRCDRAYAMPSGEQIANWAWFKRDDGFEATYPANAIRRAREENDQKWGPVT